MANISLPRDNNRITVIGGTSSSDGVTPTTIYVDPSTHRMKVDLAGGGTVSLTNKQVAFGSPLDTVTSSPNFIYDETGTGVFSVGFSSHEFINVDASAKTVTLGDVTGFVNNATFKVDITNGTYKMNFLPSSPTTTPLGVVRVDQFGALDMVLLPSDSAKFLNGNGVFSTVTGSLAIGATVTSGTAKSILFVDTGPVLAQDNTNFVWDNLNKRLGIGTNSPATVLDILTGANTQLQLKSSSASSITSLNVTNSSAYLGQLVKTGSGYTPYKNIGAHDIAIYNDTNAGNVSILNDYASGNINLAAGGSTTAHVTIASAGGVTFSNSITVGTSNSVTAGIYEVGATSDTTISRVSAGVIAVEGVTVPTISSTSTITNKRNQPRVVSATSYTTDTGTSLTVATTDIFVITAQAGTLKFNNPGGTPVQGEKIIIRIKDDGTARALTYDTQFRASSDLALPTTTVLSKTLYMGFIFNSTDTTWDLLATLNNI